MNCTIDASVLVVTWDLEMLERGALIVQTATPQGWIESQQGNRQA